MPNASKWLESSGLTNEGGLAVVLPLLRLPAVGSPQILKKMRFLMLTNLNIDQHKWAHMQTLMNGLSTH